MINILSILLSICMMLSGAAGLETEGAMANSLTIRDVYFSYNDQSFELDPALTAGVMTENGTAVIDLGMACGEESLFPMQLVLSEESATLVMEKAGKAFSIDAETLNALADEALDLDSLASDEEISAAIAQMEAAWAQALNAEAIQPDPEAAAKIEAQINEVFQPVEVSESTDSYEDTEYAVTVSCYELNHDQVFQLVDIVMNASEETASAYQKMLDSINAAFAESGEEMPEITGIRDVYDMAGATIAMNLTANESEDGLFTHVIIEMIVSIEELPEPMVINMNLYEVNGVTDMLFETEYLMDGMNLYMGGIAYNDETDNYFEVVIDVMPEESEDLTEEDYEEAVSFFITGGLTAAEEGGSDLNFLAELNTYANGFAFMIDGHEDEEGNATINVSFDYADEINQISGGLTLDLAKALFANAAEGMTPIAVDPANMASLETEFSAVVESLLVDMQTLVENESVTDMIAAITAINTAQYDTEEVTVEASENDLYSDIYDDVANDDSDSVNTELTFSMPEFAYLPEGMVLEEPDVDVEFNSVSCTIADENYDEVIYAYVYGDTYSAGIESYVLGADGAVTPVEDRIVTIEKDEGAIYAEMVDGNIVVSISYYGSDLGVEDLGKILAGMTY